MGLSIQVVGNQLIGTVRDELGRETRSDLSSLLALGDDLDLVLEHLLEPIRLLRPASIKSHLRHLRLLGDTLGYLHINKLPKTAEKWQELVIQIYRHILTRTDSKASLQTRCSNDWLHARSYLSLLLEVGLIPVSVYLPPTRENLGGIDIAPYTAKLIGQTEVEILNPRSAADKMICSVSISRTDAGYLEEIRDTLSRRRNLLLDTLTTHWTQIKSNMIFGKDLIASVDWEKLKTLILSDSPKKTGEHPAYPGDIEGLANYLAVVHYHYGGLAPSDDDFNKSIECRESRMIPRQESFGSFELIAKNVKAPYAPYGRGGWSNRNALLWWQGKINHFDVAIIAALLIMLQPSWTPTSLLLSKITNRDGKNYLDLSDKGASYEIKKHRANEMKKETLAPLAHEIISTLIEFYEPVRKILREQGDPKAEMLFLPCTHDRITTPTETTIVSYISGTAKASHKNRVWIGSVYPELISGGLPPGTVSFKKIRCTEGVLEWFRTKNIRAVSRKLGNTEKIVIEHYIPKVLLDAWNTRMIRRFQNLWLSVAAANEDFLLDITDFGTLADLHAFLKDMLVLHGTNDSPLANILNCRFGALTGGETKVAATDDSHLHIAISKSSLSALYSYQAAVIDVGLTAEDLDKVDVVTGLSPRHFLSLADLLQSQLPLDKNYEYVAYNDAAILFASDIANRTKWARLINKST